MDLSNDEANTRLQDVPSTQEQETRPSVELRSPQGPRLQKKRSDAGRPTGRRPQTYAPTSTITGRESSKARKGSIRNAIRRVFGRRSREAVPEQEPPPRSSPGHGYHRSEPTPLAPQPEIPEADMEDDALIQRTFSVPVVPITSNVQRTRSPYAVEFGSARLKPINLGSPFNAPGSTLRRRKTLPSVLMSESEAAAVQASIQSADEVGDAPRISQEPPSSEIGKALRSPERERRKSRSADDLRLTQVNTSRLSRKRSEEIQFWRESIQGGVLRASGFKAQGPQIGEAEEEEKTPMADIADPFVSAAEPSGLSPPMRRPQDGCGPQSQNDLDRQHRSFDATS